MIIVIHFHLHREWKIGSVNSPVRKPFSTKLSVEQILMGVKQNIDAVFVALAHYFPEDLDIREIDFAFVRLDSFPSNVQANHVESPASQILKIHVRQRVIGIEVI